MPVLPKVSTDALKKSPDVRISANGSRVPAPSYRYVGCSKRSPILPIPMEADVFKLLEKLLL